MGVVLDGAGLRLRNPVAADAADLFALASNPEVTRFFSWGPYVDVDEAAAFIASLPGRRARGEALELLVTAADSGRVLGLTGLSELSPRDRRCTVGTWLGRDWWGTGVNRASKALVLHLAFELLGMERVTAWANTNNGRSRAALAGLGFAPEGVLRRWHRHGDTFHDVAVFSMLRDEWAASALAAVPIQSAGRPPRAFAVGAKPPAGLHTAFT
jgi:ribosomal-protein-alanine N-acetyltransferase